MLLVSPSYTWLTLKKFIFQAWGSASPREIATRRRRWPWKLWHLMLDSWSEVSKGDKGMRWQEQDSPESGQLSAPEFSNPKRKRSSSLANLPTPSASPGLLLQFFPLDPSKTRKIARAQMWGLQAKAGGAGESCLWEEVTVFCSPQEGLCWKLMLAKRGRLSPKVMSSPSLEEYK